MQELLHLLAEASQGVEQTEVDHSSQTNQVNEENKRSTVLRPALTEWQNRYNQAIARSHQNRFISATHISQAVNSVDGVASLDPGLIKDASESELPIQGRGRYGTALGRAVHAVLQTIDLRTGKGLTTWLLFMLRQKASQNYLEMLKASLIRLFKAQNSNKLFSNRYWRELHVACPLGDQIIEGYVDLVYETAEGLMVVDYKTDQIQPG